MNLNLPDLLLASEHLVGFVIVMFVLVLLWGLTALMGRVLATTAVASPAPVAPPIAASDELPADDLVVIAATVAAMIDGRHRVVAVRPVQSSWGQQGRREIHASHRIR